MGSRVLAALTSARMAAIQLFAVGGLTIADQSIASPNEGSAGLSSPLKAPLFENRLTFRVYHILLVCTTTKLDNILDHGPLPQAHPVYQISCLT